MKHSLKILIVSTMISTSSIPFTASAMKNNNNSTNIKNSSNGIITKKITNQLKEFENCVKKYEQKINNLNSKITNFKENKISDKLETTENYSELSEHYRELKKLINCHISYNNDNNKKEKSEKELENYLKKVKETKETIEAFGFNPEKMIQEKLKEMRKFEKKEIDKENDGNKNKELKIIGIKLYANIIKNLENIKKLYDEIKNLYDIRMKCLSNYNDINKSHLYTKKQSTNETYNIPKNSAYNAYYNLKQGEVPRINDNMYYIQQKNLYNNINKKDNSKINEKLGYTKKIVYSTNLYPEKLQNNQKLKGILKNSQNKKIKNLSQHSNTNLVIKKTKSLYDHNDIDKSHLYTKKKPTNEIFNIPKSSGYYAFYNLKQKEEPRKINNIYYVPQKNLYNNNNLYNNANISKENNSKINERKILNKSVKFNEEKEKNKILKNYKEEDLDKKIKEIKKQIEENYLSSRYNTSLMYCEPTQLKKMLKKSQNLKEEILSLNVHKKLDKISKEMREKVSDAVEKIYKDNLNDDSKNSLSTKTQEETQEYLKKEKYEDLKELKDIYDNLEIFEKCVSKEIEKREKYKETYQNRYEKKKNYIFNRNIQQYPIQTNNVHISQQRNIQQNNNIKHDMKNNYQIKNLLNSVHLEKSLYNNNDNNLKNEKMRDIILAFKNIKNKDLFNNHKRQQSF